MSKCRPGKIVFTSYHVAMTAKSRSLQHCAIAMGRLAGGPPWGQSEGVPTGTAHLGHGRGWSLKCPFWELWGWREGSSCHRMPSQASLRGHVSPQICVRSECGLPLWALLWAPNFLATVPPQHYIGVQSMVHLCICDPRLAYCNPLYVEIKPTCWNKTHAPFS